VGEGKHKGGGVVCRILIQVKVEGKNGGGGQDWGLRTQDERPRLRR